VKIDGYGEPIQLDLDPDVRLAVLLSDELRLDEIECVRLLLVAQDCGDLSAERAAGIWYEERYDQLSSLVRVLEAEALGNSFESAWGRAQDGTLTEALVSVALVISPAVTRPRTPGDQRTAPHPALAPAPNGPLSPPRPATPPPRSAGPGGE